MSLEIAPLHGRPVLELLGKRRLLCVGDLHIGLEHEMRQNGVHVPSQTHRMEKELLSLAPGHDGLIILGDVKHAVPGTSRQELRELPRFFRSLLDVYADVQVVRGNHDTRLEEMLPEGVMVRPASGMVVEGVGLVHGHTWPAENVMACATLVAAHNHPAVVFQDGLGTSSIERCWVRARFKVKATERYPRLPRELIMVPPMNPSLRGSPVNFLPPKLLGPLFNQDLVDLGKAKMYTLDGVYLGQVGKLSVERRGRFKYDE